MKGINSTCFYCKRRFSCPSNSEMIRGMCSDFYSDHDNNERGRLFHKTKIVQEPVINNEEISEIDDWSE